ncbi:hypothetical protein EJ03DRAFT_306268 [Teratosphaeria nubilosa]|uniref:PLP-dependent transferase n=1 Tax=Teratosphaeria nubilosa TaxID=161662 RepID=A0A6G1LJN7_9PEZI|nr:hypothetical protein EJ03DRAFT_306268 [Teratosphaeria nubilosa]
MTGGQFKHAAASVIQEIEQYYSGLPSRPVLPSIPPGHLRKLLPSEPPKQGEAWQEIEKDIERVIMLGITHWQHPKFMAFFPANSTYPSMLGEMWSAALTAPAFNWICSPAVTELETVVLDWLAQILALPSAFQSSGEGGGVVQGSASEAIVTVMIAARERYIRRQLEREDITDPDEVEDRSCELRAKLVTLGSDQAHSSTKKAAIIAGTRFRSISTDKSRAYALTGENLRAKIQELEAKGLRPYYLTVSIGTTNTCAVDDLASITEVARDYPDMWIHCDAAYAGAALVLPEYQHLSRQLETVDSFDMNMHKWLLTNFDASCLFVQKRRDLTDALSITPAYLRNQFTDSGLVTDYRDWQIPLGRRFRSLKIWFVLRTWGVEGLQQHIRRHIKLGELFANLIESRSNLFSILTPPAFALTVFTVNPSSERPHNLGLDLQRSNGLTKEVFTIIEEEKDFFLTSTVVGGTYAIRVVSANPLAEEKYLREIFEKLVATTERALSKGVSSNVASGADLDGIDPS